MNDKRVTLLDIAKRLGVSHSTISLALRNHYSISPKRREQVKRMAEEMGYQPDPFLSSLAAYRKRHSPAKFQGTIAWINHWDPPARLRQFREFDRYWHGATEAAKQFGYHLEEVRWPVDCSPKRLEGILLFRGVQGVLIPPHHELLDWGNFDWSKFSVIRFGMSVQNPDSNLVTADNFRGVSMAIQRIYEYGYRRIGLIVNEEFDHRLGGSYVGGFCYTQSLLKLSPALPPLLTHYRPRDDGSSDAAPLAAEKKRLQQWLTRHKPDAVLTTEITMPGLIKELGLQIPRDLAVAGTSVHDIPLDAGIDQHSEAVGRMAVDALVKQIHVNERGEPRDPCRILVESRWQDGKSLPPKN